MVPTRRRLRVATVHASPSTSTTVPTSKSVTHQAIGDEWRYRYQLVKYALFVEDSESVVQVPEKGRPSLEARRAQHFHRFGVDEAKPELAAEDVPPALSTL